MTTLAALVLLAPVQTQHYDMKVWFDKPGVSQTEYVRKMHPLVTALYSEEMRREGWLERTRIALEQEYAILVHKNPEMIGMFTINQVGEITEMEVKSRWYLNGAEATRFEQTLSHGRSELGSGTRGSGQILNGFSDLPSIESIKFDDFDVAVIAGNDELLQKLVGGMHRVPSKVHQGTSMCTVKIERSGSGQIQLASITDNDRDFVVNKIWRTKTGWQMEYRGWGNGYPAHITLTKKN